MFNLNTISIPQDSQVSRRNREQDSFPTVGLKSILQNSDLLELLLKPIANKEDDGKKMKDLQVENYVDTNMGTFVPELSDLNLDELFEPNKQQTTDHDYVGCHALKLDANTNEQEKSYQNAFLGPRSIWDKNEIFQIEKFGIEYLGIDEFLNENNLNEEDIQFLDGLQNSDSLGTSSLGSDLPHSTAQPALKVRLDNFSQPKHVSLSPKGNQIFFQNENFLLLKMINQLLIPLSIGHWRFKEACRETASKSLYVDAFKAVGRREIER